MPISSDKRLVEILDSIETYLKSINKQIKFISTDHFDKDIKILEKLKLSGYDIENYIIVRSIKNGPELLRWAYYDVEFVFDDRKSGKIGLTGETRNAMSALGKIGTRPVPRT